MQQGDVMVGLSAGAGSLGVLDLLMSNGFVGDPSNPGAGTSVEKTVDEAGGEKRKPSAVTDKGSAGGTRVIKRFTWRYCYAVHVDFSDVLDHVSPSSRSRKPEPS
jgi:hypothetical protein